MESGPTRGKPAKGGITPAGTAGGAQHPNIEALVHAGGQIMIGTVKPIKHAAVAHDGKKTLAMLRCKAGESINSILDRLNAAIAVAKATGQCVDDLNRPNSDVTYKY